MPELAWAEELAATMMLDTVEVTREVDPDADSLPFDHVTGESLVPPWQVIYAGVGQVAPMNTQPVRLREGDEQITTSQYAVALPLTAPEFLPEDEVKVTASTRDPSAVGQVYRVIEPKYASLQVTRRALAELRC